MPCWLAWIIRVHYIAYLAGNIFTKTIQHNTGLRKNLCSNSNTKSQPSLSLKPLPYHNLCVYILITWEQIKQHYYSSHTSQHGGNLGQGPGNEKGQMTWKNTKQRRHLTSNTVPERLPGLHLNKIPNWRDVPCCWRRPAHLGRRWRRCCPLEVSRLAV